jgi:hypothetical protein
MMVLRGRPLNINDINIVAGADGTDAMATTPRLQFRQEEA